MFDFSRQLANDWNVGARATAKKSLLLVLAVNEKESFTQFSKSVQSDLPEAVLGEMSQRMKGLITGGDFAGGLNAGVHHFVSSMARKLALNPADFEEPTVTASNSSAPAQSAEEPAATTTRPSRVVRPRTTTPAPTPTPPPSEEPSVAVNDQVESSPKASPERPGSDDDRSQHQGEESVAGNH